MKTLRMTIPALIALALLIGFGNPSEARAGIRVKATLKTPNIRVQVTNHPRGHRIQRLCDLPVIRRHVNITRQDRRIARRISWYTGVPTHKLIQLKRQGYQWREIGRHFDLPRPMVRAAMNSRSWERFLDSERCGTRSRGHRGAQRRVAYHDRDCRH